MLDSNSDTSVTFKVDVTSAQTSKLFAITRNLDKRIAYCVSTELTALKKTKNNIDNVKKSVFNTTAPSKRTF
jgi:hypothetical protein